MDLDGIVWDGIVWMDDVLWMMNDDILKYVIINHIFMLIT